jgi:hypothetical protein
MPRKPRGVKKKGTTTLTEDQVNYLIGGVCLDGFAPDYGHPRNSPLFHVPFESEAHIREAWEQNRNFLMNLQGGQRSFDRFAYFERPRAWWNFETLPDQRRVFKKWYGCDDKGWGYFDSPEGLSYPEPAEVLESDKEYLLRHPELLTEAERENL